MFALSISREVSLVVFEMIQNLLSESLGCSEEQITPGTDLLGELGVSETDLEEILDALGEELSFSWRSRDLEEIATVGDLIRYVESRI